MNDWGGTTEQRRKAVLGKNTVSDADMANLEERWVAGETLLSLAAELNVIPETIKQRLRDRGWKAPLNVFKAELSMFPVRN